MELVISIGLSILIGLAIVELYAWQPTIIDWLIEKAVRRLPPAEQSRYREEWRAHVNELPNSVWRVVHAVGCLVASLKSKSGEVLTEHFSIRQLFAPASQLHRDWQTTVGQQIELSGVGIHSGAVASLTICPAEADTGLVFVRSDGDNEVQIPALLSFVCATDMCRAIGDPSGAAVSTIEHLIAALGGLGIDNAVIEIDGAEVPILDGSAAPFVEAIHKSGIRKLNASRRFIKIVKAIRIEAGRSVGELLPYDGFAVDVTIDFNSPLIGTQRIALDVTPTNFIAELARARTFGFVSDVERLWACGYAMGTSLENTVVLGEGQIMNPEGLRWADEFVRHKALDVIGDLALAGAPILGRYRSVRGGHHLNYEVLRALMANCDAWIWVEDRSLCVSGVAEFAAG